MQTSAATCGTAKTSTHLLAWMREYRPVQASKWLDDERHKDLR